MSKKLVTLGLAAFLAMGGPLALQPAFGKHGADDPPGDDRGGDRGVDDVLPGFPVEIEVETPHRGDRVGIDGRGWMVDLEIEYQVPLARTGFTRNAPGASPGFQLTGPGVHNNVAPFPGNFGPGADERLPGLIVLLSTTGAATGGPCRNLANLFNLTGVTDLRRHEVELWDTWLVGAPNFGVGVRSTLFVAVADDLNGDRIFNDAPDVLPDTNGDGICTQQDLMDYGVASNIEQVNFFINGAVNLRGVPIVP